MTTHPVRQFVATMMGGYAVQVIVLALSFIGSILIARILGPEDRGVYAWLMALHGILAAVMLFGFETAFRKQGQGSPQHQADWFATAVVTGWIVLAVVLLPLYGLAIQAPLGGRYPGYVLFMLLMVGVAQVVTSLHMLLAAQQRPWGYTLATTAPRLLTLGVVLGLVATAQLTVKTTLLAQMIPLFAVAVVLMFAVFGPRWWGLRWRPRWSLIQRHWQFLGASYLSVLALVLVLKIDQFLLGWFGLVEALGQYAVAGSLIDVMQLGPMMVGFFLLPRLQALPAPDRWAFLLKTLIVLVTVMGFGSGLLWGLAPWGIPLLFGGEYYPAVSLFHILLLAGVFLSIFTVCQQALATFTERWTLALAPIIACSLNIGLNILWIPTYGAAGAAWASVLAYGVGMVIVLGVLMWFWRRRLSAPPV